MFNVFVLVISSVALAYLLVQLIKAGRQGKFLETLRDLLIIFVAILMTVAIFWLAIKGFKFFRTLF
tara:strand:+ start:888 stop:1085 length:198 start_codon:yes stop_codon:yes gene_type:complete